MLRILHAISAYAPIETTLRCREIIGKGGNQNGVRQAYPHIFKPSATVSPAQNPSGAKVRRQNTRLPACSRAFPCPPPASRMHSEAPAAVFAHRKAVRLPAGQDRPRTTVRGRVSGSLVLFDRQAAYTAPPQSLMRIPFPGCPQTLRLGCLRLRLKSPSPASAAVTG